MSDFIPNPTVKTIYKDKQYNFTLVIYAYRKLSLPEATHLYRKYLSSNKLKHPPQGKTVIIKTFVE